MKLEARIADRLKEARIEAGLSLEALGVAVGIDEATAKVRIHQYESGKHAPPFAMLERLSKILRKPLAWFVCPEDEKALQFSLYEISTPNRADILEGLMRQVKLDL